jgi:hypothetical protein
MTTIPNQIIQSASLIAREVYSDLKNLGRVTDYIQENSHTADFELSDGFRMRAIEKKNEFYYNIFRAS